jgi:hypothetical protein
MAFQNFDLTHKKERVKRTEKIEILKSHESDKKNGFSASSLGFPSFVEWLKLQVKMGVTPGRVTRDAVTQ